MYEKDKIILQDEILDDDADDVLEENKREQEKEEDLRLDPMEEVKGQDSERHFLPPISEDKYIMSQNFFDEPNFNSADNTENSDEREQARDSRCELNQEDSIAQPLD